MTISPDTLSQLFQFVLGLAILILVHELGHFFAARLLKIDVEEFGIGFPPRAVKLFEAKGTKFTLNWIPLGGFVRIKGDNDPEVPGGLASAKPWVRLAVLFAGPLTNLLLGAVLAVLLFYNLGEPVLDKVVIQQVAPNSPAEQAGLLPGDVIRSVDGQRTASIEDLHRAIYARLGQPTRLGYERDGQQGEVTLTPRNPPPADEGAIGIMMGYEMQKTTLWRAIPRGVSASAEYIKAIFLLPVNLLRGEISTQEARPVGYKGMFDIYQEIRNPLWFFMMITMSLGVFNLFPIPALDGGRILLTLPELILRRRVPPQLENTVHLVGFALLLVLLIFINLQDFINPVVLP